jgi:hypothetical protein
MENVYIYARVLHVTAENMLSVIVTSSQSWNDQRKGGDSFVYEQNGQIFKENRGWIVQCNVNPILPRT